MESRSVMARAANREQGVTAKDGVFWSKEVARCPPIMLAVRSRRCSPKFLIDETRLDVLYDEMREGEFAFVLLRLTGMMMRVQLQVEAGTAEPRKVVTCKAGLR